MGRKIPGKKHRGVKDPLKQQAKRQAELETKINAPPKDADDQAVPRSLRNVVRLKEAVKSGKVTKTKSKKKKKGGLISVGAENNKPLHPRAKPDKAIPVFKQKPGESKQKFLHRVERDTHAFLKEAQFERKYGVLVNRNPNTGEIEGVAKCDKDELDDAKELKVKDKDTKKNKKKKKKAVDKAKMTKAQKKKEKAKEKKEKQKEKKSDEFEKLKDEVKFGEVAHEPPQIKIRPKRADAKSPAKPGKKDLLLRSVLKKGKVSKKNSKKLASVDKSGKRKKLPVGERRQLEKQQSEVIAAYKKLKLRKSTRSTT